MSFSEDTIREVNKSSRKDLVTMEELKPCPFCGSPAIIKVREHPTADPPANASYYIQCPECRARTNSARDTPLKAIQYAVSIWNERVDNVFDDSDMETITNTEHLTVKVKYAENENNNIKLKKCPFCGGNASIIKDWNCYAIECDNCGVLGKISNTTVWDNIIDPDKIITDKMAIEKTVNCWNKRKL